MADQARRVLWGLLPIPELPELLGLPGVRVSVGAQRERQRELPMEERGLLEADLALAQLAQLVPRVPRAKQARLRPRVKAPPAEWGVLGLQLLEEADRGLQGPEEFLVLRGEDQQRRE